MSYTDILICIFGLFCSSYISRILPLAVLGRRPLPTFLSLWLKYVPTAVFGALIFVSIFGDAHSGFRFSWTNVEFLAAIPGAVCLGMGAIVCTDFLVPHDSLI